jgi:hypothetical protein
LLIAARNRRPEAEEQVGLLRSLRAWFNPTNAWEELDSLALVLDLDKQSLSGVQAGEVLERLSFLGPGKVTAIGFAWPHKGIDASVDAGRIREMGVYFGHADEPDRGEFTGSVRYRNAPLRLSKLSREAELQHLFGPASDREQDEEEIILYYERPDGLWQLELATDGTLKYIGFAVKARS